MRARIKAEKKGSDFFFLMVSIESGVGFDV